jgi:hypothetical protein
MTIEWSEEPQQWRLHYHTCEGRVLDFRLNKRATFVDIYSTDPEAVDDIGAVFLGPALASALHLRGIRVIHASAVVVDGCAILVAGISGAGKSTLTTALVANGAPLLADDMAVLASGENGISVQSGYPRLRLCSDATGVAGRPQSGMPKVFSSLVSNDKRWLDPAELAGGFCATPVPLGGIYLLAPRKPEQPAVEILPLPPHRAGLALLGHLYGARWLRIPKPQALNWCADIAGRTPIRIVHAPPGLARISETAEAIVADCRRSAPAQTRTLIPAGAA